MVRPSVVPDVLRAHVRMTNDALVLPQRRAVVITRGDIRKDCTCVLAVPLDGSDAVIEEWSKSRPLIVIEHRNVRVALPAVDDLHPGTRRSNE
jgi:hypothetical protein